MSDAVRLVLLGKPALLLGGRRATPITKKSLALLAALHEEGELTRAALATLLWGDRSDAAALHNLRQELYRLRATAPGVVVADGAALRLAPGVTSDVREAVVTRAEGTPPIPGEFLDGFPADGEAFGEWLAARRAVHQSTGVDRLRACAERAAAHGEFEAAEEHLRRALEADLLREDVWRDLLRVLAAAGRRDQLAVEYRRLHQLLDQQLGVAPAPETRELFEQLSTQRARSPLAVARAALDGALVAARLHRHPEACSAARRLLRLRPEVRAERKLLARACELLFASSSNLGDLSGMEQAASRLRDLARLDLTFETACLAQTAGLWLRQGRLAEVRDLTRELWDERSQRENIRPALLWRAVALMRLGDLEGAYQTFAFVTGGRLTSPLAAEAWLGLGTVTLNMGRLVEAGAALTAGLRAARRAGDVALTMRARVNLGVWHLLRGEHALAETTFVRAVEDARALGQAATRRALLINLFKARYEQGRFGAAADALDEAWASLADAPDPHMEGAILNNLGALARARGDYGAALDAVTLAIDNARVTGNRVQEARRLLARAELLTELGAGEDALHEMRAAADLVRAHGLRELEPWLELLTADVALQQGRLAACEEQLAAVSCIAETLTADDRSRLRCLTAALALRRDDADAALAALSDAPDASFRACHLALRARAKCALQLDTTPEQAEVSGWLDAGALVALDEARLRRTVCADPGREAGLLGGVEASLASRPDILSAFRQRWLRTDDPVLA